MVLVSGVLTILATGGDSVYFDPHGIADAGPDQHVSSGPGSYVYLDGSGSNTPLGADPGDKSVHYSWEVVAHPPNAPIFWFREPNTVNPVFIANYPGEYVIQLKVKLNGQAGLDTVRITAYADDDEILPVARAGADVVVKHGALVELNASQSFQDNIFIPLRHSWFMTEAPLDSASALSSTEVVNPSFIAEFNEGDGQKGNSHYEFRLHVINENDWVSAPDHVDVYVYPSEGYVHPAPNAGPDQRVSTGLQVNLDGRESFDVDGRPLSYEWQFYSRPQGSRAVLSNSNTPTPSFTPDVDGAYVVFLSVDNGELNSSSDLINSGTKQSLYDWQYQDRVTVIATSSRPEPVSMLGPDQRIAFTGPGSLILDASRSTQITGSSLYFWRLISKPATSNATVVITDNNNPHGAQLNYDMEGDYVVSVIVENIYMSGYDTSDRIVYKITSNTPPVADAGADQDVTVNSQVTLNGSNSSDVDMDSVAYSWSLVSTPVDWTTWPGEWPLLSEGRDASPTFTPRRNGEYRLRLTVNDRELSSVADEVLINVSGSGVNGVPIADAGVDQSVTVGDTVLLDGGGSSDPDNDPLSYNWTIEIRPSGSSAAIGDPSSETPSFVADVEGSYQVQLIVNDGLVNSAPDSMTVTAAVAGVCANPLTLMTSLPFAPGLGEIATNIQVDAQGVDTLSAIAALTTVDENVYRASIPDGSNLNQAEFTVYGSNWEEISRSHTNPISDSESPSFVVRNIADDIYYKLDVDFTGTGMQEVQIDALSGCRCGSNAEDCP
ncbi:MAG: PKD domain-containing protein [Gammaproteobacteria bacterium]|nr:PKD domain-containing protein [Gammaproteobacteria bacterium]